MTHSLNGTPTKPDISQERLRVLLSVATTINLSLVPHEVAEVALWLAFEITELRAGVVLLFQGDQRIVLTSQGFSGQVLRQLASPKLDFKESIVEEALASDLPKVFYDLRLMSDDPVLALCRAAGLQSVICLPLRAPGNLLGVMLIGDSQHQLFEVSDVDLLQAIAGQISTSLRNAWVFAQSQRQLEKLETVTQAARAVVSSLDSDQILTRIWRRSPPGWIAKPPPYSCWIRYARNWSFRR
jgi:GAF domain-containing protein